MAHIIRGSSAFQKRYLKVDSNGVETVSTAALGRKRRFAFDQIDCILMSPQFELSLQVGQEVFRVPTKPGKAAHEETIKVLLQAVRAATAKQGTS